MACMFCKLSSLQAQRHATVASTAWKTDTVMLQKLSSQLCEIELYREPIGLISWQSEIILSELVAPIGYRLVGELIRAQFLLGSLTLGS